MKHEPHPHYDMIVAKAANMDLVIFRKDYQNTPWCRLVDSELPLDESKEYFLCLPHHKDACLHWLNGGEVEAMHFENQMPNSGVKFDSGFACIEDCVESYPWKFNHIFMQNHEIRIKPRKEKRWIGVRAKDGATTVARNTVQEARTDTIGVTGNWQFIEIEVDV